MCRNQAWGSVCYRGFTYNIISDARVICRQIGLPNVGMIYFVYTYNVCSLVLLAFVYIEYYAASQ